MKNLGRVPPPLYRVRRRDNELCVFRGGMLIVIGIDAPWSAIHDSVRRDRHDRRYPFGGFPKLEQP